MISSKAQEYRDELVKKLCEAMENGTAPWQKTWTDGDAPFNAVSGRSYRGINTINLALQSQSLGHAGDPRWCTYDQAKEKGWHVKQGEKGTHVEFYKFDEKPKFDEFGAPVLDADGKQEVEKSVLVRNYVVFHASQIEGIPPYEPKKRNPIEASEKAERILKESGAEIRHGGNEAFYNLTGDYIQLPERDQLKTQADYYATALHEMGHWTGHPSRLNRPTSNNMNSEIYAKEELVAEITSMFVSAETGIPQTQEHFDNHASYVNYWVKAVKEDPNALFKAVNQAQKASEEILKYERIREREQAQEQTEQNSQAQTLQTEIQNHEQKPAITAQMIRDLKLIDGNSEIFENPRVENQQFKGKILHVDQEKGYCVQLVGKNSLYAHKLEKLERTPEIGENLKLSYDEKGEKAKISVQQERHHGLKR